LKIEAGLAYAQHLMLVHGKLPPPANTQGAAFNAAGIAIAVEPAAENQGRHNAVSLEDDNDQTEILPVSDRARTAAAAQAAASGAALDDAMDEGAGAFQVAALPHQLRGVIGMMEGQQQAGVDAGVEQYGTPGTPFHGGGQAFDGSMTPSSA
jgi:hypothetical protein